MCGCTLVKRVMWLWFSSGGDGDGGVTVVMKIPR